MMRHIFGAESEAKQATHGKRPQGQEPRKLSGVEDLNVGGDPELVEGEEAVYAGI
jgi:hypothetical protein